LKGTPSFYPGSTVHPETDFIEPQLVKFDKKVSAGAQFFQTQGIFDLASLRRFMQYASQFDVKILAGIIVLMSARMAKYMNANVPGIIISQDIIDELENVEKGKGLQKGIEIAARFIKTIKDENLCHGVHIMAVGNEGIVPEIIEAAELAGVS
jgi:5,10-methylenetetrahydrofolate reductase